MIRIQPKNLLSVFHKEARISYIKRVEAVLVVMMLHLSIEDLTRQV